MKKVLVMLLVMAMISGCAGFGKWSTGAQKVVDMICAPTPEQQDTAAKMLAALDAAQAIGAVFYPPLGIEQASAVLNVIRGGGCFLVTQLTEAFKVVDAANEAVQAKQLKMVKMAPAALPEYAPLRKFIK
jgi:uncharacterized protein YceK